MNALTQQEAHPELIRGCRQNIFELGGEKNPFWGKPFADLDEIQPEWQEKTWATYGPSFGFLHNGKRFLANPDQAMWHRLALSEFKRLSPRWVWLRGPAGTGKTYTSVRVFGALGRERLSWYLCPSNQACKEARLSMREAGFSDLEKVIQTPHTRFELANSDHGFFGKPAWWPTPPGSQASGKSRVFVLDEVFFWDSRTAALTLSCIATGSIVLACGDEFQNRPVDGSEVFRHLHSKFSKPYEPLENPVEQIQKLFEMEHIIPPSITLTEVFRTEKPCILKAAHSVLRGEWPEPGDGFSITQVEDTDAAIALAAKKMRDGFTICVPTNLLAQRVSTVYCKDRFEPGDAEAGFFRTGDIVRPLINDHRLGISKAENYIYKRWRRPGTSRQGWHEIQEMPVVGRAGGKTFRLKYTKDYSRSILKMSADALREDFGDAAQDILDDEQRDSARGLLCHANVLTVHRAQGSTVKKVLVVIPAWIGPWQCREWLYTSITRAKLEVEVVVAGKPNSKNPELEAGLLAAVRSRLLSARDAAPDATNLPELIKK